MMDAGMALMEFLQTVTWGYHLRISMAIFGVIYRIKCERVVIALHLLIPFLSLAILPLLFKNEGLVTYVYTAAVGASSVVALSFNCLSLYEYSRPDGDETGSAYIVWIACPALTTFAALLLIATFVMIYYNN